EEKEGALEAVRKYLEENEGMRDSFTYHALHPDASQAVFPDGIARAVNDIRDELRGLTAYTAHPTKELLKIHDPEVFGCSMCHNGNGRSVTSVELAHGLNKYWLYPMHQRENMDAGCVQCHKDDFRLDHGDTFNEAKRLFQNRGCWGCHVYEGFNSQPAEILDLINEDHAIETKLDKMGVQAAVAEPEKRQTISMEMGRLQTRKLEIEGQIVDIRREVQKVGPSLTNLKAKVKQEWILPWLLDPTSYRPTTKMPSFFENLPADLKVEHATAIAAYLWQNADDPATILTETFKKGDPTRGQELFESRGCLGCHTIEKDGQLVGDGFAADLSRIGEKHNYQYTVKWVLEPDNGIMPNLRLSVRDAEDIATYLTGLSTNRNYAPTPQLDNGGLFERGEKYVLHYGCAGCHTIKGLENEKGIGTELTVEGSKPKERLDFGRLEHGFKERKEYTHKHFFENKLRTPGVYGLGKIYDENLDGLDRLKMPNFRLNEPQITALTTMILGSVETPIPETWQYNPTGRDKYVQDGWWVINKYNCMGCHQILPEQEPHLWGLDRYQGMDENNIKPESRRPPTLVSLGARVNPDWLADFLRNPALTHDPATYNGNGVRPYLSIRMPSFRFSEREIQTLVRFFQALDSQPIPYTPPALEPLTPRELEGARALFTGVNCTLCHATGDAEHDKKMSAPKLLVAREKLKHPWTVRWMHDPQSIIPWTGMPQNFPAEQVLTLNNGQQIRGTNYAAPTAKKLGRIKLHSGEEIPVDYGTVNMVESSRHVGSLMPKELDFYEGDYGELMARYLLLHFDEAEFERTKPAK
ncbi:MAG: c-type cytochrome, partial [Planctomycetes bacterium]|nr:c-type cytochrome [Planctomycetota bacterium]